MLHIYLLCPCQPGVHAPGLQQCYCPWQLHRSQQQRRQAGAACACAWPPGLPLAACSQSGPPAAPQGPCSTQRVEKVAWSICDTDCSEGISVCKCVVGGGWEVREDKVCVYGQWGRWLGVYVILNVVKGWTAEARGRQADQGKVCWLAECKHGRETQAFDRRGDAYEQGRWLFTRLSLCLLASLRGVHVHSCCCPTCS
eukprot:1136789-Pelagomonas_calceolata.AAC.11